MTSSIDKLGNVPRLLMEANLEPIQGSRFQPTAFADLGAAVYERPDGKRMILLETSQSVANRLEQTCLDGGGPRIIKDLDGLPYILVKLTGDVASETSSLVEPHRINSPFIINDKELQTKFKTMSGYSKGHPLDWKKIGKTFFFFDPNAILHGVFMANLEDGRIKLPRVVTGFIEAEDIREAASGGVKNNPLDPSGKIRVEGYDKDVYGNVPYHRMEYTAGKITAYFNVDLALLDGYGFDPVAKDLMVYLALYKIRKFMNTGLRLRTACDLKMIGDLKVKAPEGFILPDENALIGHIRTGIKTCTEKKLFASPPVTQIIVKVKEKKKEDKPQDDTEKDETV